MFPRDTTDPLVANHVLRIVNSEKTQAKIARIENGSRQNAQENDGGIYLPWAREYIAISGDMRFDRFSTLFFSSGMTGFFV